MRSLIIGLVAMGAIVVMGEPLKFDKSGNDRESKAVSEVSKGLGAFAANFFKNIVEENQHKNVVTSPLSASIVLAMAQFGARTRTQEQIALAFKSSRDKTVAILGYQYLINSFKNTVDVTVNVASKIFVNRGVDIKSDFKAITSQVFHSHPEQVNFANGAEAAGIINKWVESQTNHKIKKILNPDDVSANTGLVLTNTLYFKGTWKQKFSQTFNETFYVDPNTKKSVSMMLTNMKLYCGDLPELKAKFVEIPYRNGDFSMMIILPDDVNGLSALVDGLARFTVGGIREQGVHKEADIRLPKFKIESSLSLYEPMKKMGLTDMFSENADFSGMTDGKLKIDKFVQKAVLEIDENGTEGSAASAAGIGERISSGETYEFHATHPFVFILHTKDIVLFEGTVIDPEQ